jgi:hypothetical protein
MEMKKTVIKLLHVVAVLLFTLGCKDSTSPGDLRTRALAFDGIDDYVYLGGYHDLEFRGELTISAWVNVDTFHSHAGIISKGDIFGGNNVCAYGLGVNKDDHKVYFIINTDKLVRRSLESLNPINSKTWYHLAGTFQPGVGLKLYIDGHLERAMLISDSAISYRSISSRLDVRIGDAQRQYENGFFKGKIDEVRFWDVVRDESQIKMVMNYRLLGKEKGLVVYYPFDQDAGQTVRDFAGSRNGHLGSTPHEDENDPVWIDIDLPYSSQ